MTKVRSSRRFDDEAIMPIEIRPGQFVLLHGIPHDLTIAEARKLADVITAMARQSG